VIKFLKLPDDAICVPIDFVEGDTNLITFDMNEYFNPATYKVTVQTLAGIDADDWSLNAKAPGDEYTPADIYIFNSPKVEIVDGNIVFDSSSISVNGNDKYADKYEIIVTKDGDNEEYSAEIVVDYSNCIKDGTFIKYILPSEIEGLKIEAEKDYAFKIRAITTEQSCVNSKFTGNKQFTRETRVTNVVIDEGKLKWTASETGSYLIKITKVENNETIIITNGYERNGKVYTYEFKEQELPIWGKNTSTHINPNVNYTISVSKVGNNGENGNVISSSYEDKSNVYRIENVQNTEIKTEKGVLTWNKIEEAIGYQLKIIDNENTSNMYEYTIRDNVNSINLASVCYDGSENLLPAGNYKVQIRAIGGSKINSLLTVSDKEFIKLKSVESIKFKGDKITWDEIENAQGYIVKFGNSDESFKTTDAEISLPQYNGKLTITITTYGGDSIDLLNSNECEFITTTDNPESVQNLKYNYEENRFEWTADEFNEDTDIFVISYEFKKYGVDDSGDRTEEKSVFIEESTKDNFYYISKMGKYLNFTVVVRRTYREDVILDSSKQQYEEFSLALFICGAGTKGDPYVIQTQEMLSNMKYYPNAYYQINKDISISISIDDTETYTPAILNFEFAGYINGNNHKIDLGEINLTDVKEFALFTSLNGASITDLDISGNVKNDIKNQITGDVKIALLAINATNAKLENVRIVTSTISVEEYEDNNSNSYEIVRDDKKGEYGHLYVAGFFAVDNGSTLTNCDIAGDDAEGIKGLTINLDIDVEGDEYIGGISAKADKTQVVNGEFDVCITNGESLIMYVGGLFGYYTGDNLNNENCTINRTQVNITINEVKSLYVGGIVGFAQYVTIQDNKVSGQINYSSISNIYWYFGGIAGFVESGLIYNNTVSEDDINIKVDSVGDGLNIGLVVGYLGIDTNKSLTCELKGQYSQGPNPTDITIGTLKLGVYGKKAEGVDIDTSYTE